MHRRPLESVDSRCDQICILALQSHEIINKESIEVLYSGVSLTFDRHGGIERQFLYAHRGT